MFNKMKKNDKNIKKVFGKYIDKNKLDDLMNGKIENKKLNFKKGIIDYIIFQVKDDNFDNIPLLIEKSIEIVNKNKGVVGSIFSSFGIVFYGIQFFTDSDESNRKENYLSLINDLITIMKNDIRFVYGKTNSALGNLGSKNCMSYGPIIPNLGNKMNQLMNIEFGQKIECMN